MNTDRYVEIILPDKTTYEVVKEDNSQFTDKDVLDISKTLSVVNSVQISVRTKNCMAKKQKLILWGDTLKNSYLHVREYK